MGSCTERSGDNWDILQRDGVLDHCIVSKLSFLSVMLGLWLWRKMTPDGEEAAPDYCTNQGSTRETEPIGDTHKEIYVKALAHVIMEANSPVICLPVYRPETQGGWSCSSKAWEVGG